MSYHANFSYCRDACLFPVCKVFAVIFLLFFLQLKVGIFKWTPEPNEGPYRPFIMEKTRSGYMSHAKVMAQNDEELKKEIDHTESKLKCYTFVCFFLCALQGFKHVKKARELVSTGSDVGARDALLDAKIKQHHSYVAGLIICWGVFMGIFLIVLLPFMWIPYLIVFA